MPSTRGNQRGLGIVAWLVLIMAAAALLFAGYIWLMLTWRYASGERAGWVQKLSNKGYACKTWEGEMAMVSLPGSMAEKFLFTVRDEKVADQINAEIGKRVALHYEEHIGLPSSCFGDTGYFVTGVKVIDETPTPLIVPANPPTSPPSTQRNQAAPKQ